MENRSQALARRIGESLFVLYIASQKEGATVIEAYHWHPGSSSINVFTHAAPGLEQQATLRLFPPPAP